MKSFFRLNSKYILLTFDNYDFDLIDILQYIQFVILEKNLILFSYFIVYNKQNIKAFIILNRRINLFDSDIFEIDFRDTQYNSTLESFYLLKSIKKYAKKKNKFITNIEELKN